MGDQDGSALLLEELRASVRRIEDRIASGEARDDRMASDVRALKQIVGLNPPTPSVAPQIAQANTYRMRTLVIASVATATGVLFDRVIALLARLIGG